MRPDGIGRHDLLMRSSRMAEGRFWLLMLKGRRLSQIQRRMRGRRESSFVGDWGVLTSVRDRELQMAKAVEGKRMVLRSLAVNR